MVSLKATFFFFFKFVDLQEDGRQAQKVGLWQEQIQ